jgi:deoxycytidine triphosphate deaminase
LESFLVPECAESGEHHDEPKLISTLEDFGITHRTSWLNDGRDTMLRCFFDRVWLRIKD